MILYGGYIMNCKLFETLSACVMELNGEYNPKGYSCDENCPFFDKGCFYQVECPPSDKNLQATFGGWQKYAKFTFNDKKATIENGYVVVNILHLISPERVSDIVVFRVAKKNKDDTYAIRYFCKQGGKKHLCTDIKDLNLYIKKYFQYEGRDLNKKDFTNV